MPEPAKDTKTAAPVAASSVAAPSAAASRAPAAAAPAPQPEKRLYVVRNRIAGTIDGKRDPRRGDTVRLTDAEAAALGGAVELSR